MRFYRFRARRKRASRLFGPLSCQNTFSSAPALRRGEKANCAIARQEANRPFYGVFDSLRGVHRRKKCRPHHEIRIWGFDGVSLQARRTSARLRNRAPGLLAFASPSYGRTARLQLEAEN